MQFDTLENIYKTNNEFKEYVDRYCEQRKLTLNQAMSHKLIGIMAEYYSSKH